MIKIQNKMKKKHVKMNTQFNYGATKDDVFVKRQKINPHIDFHNSSFGPTPNL